MGIKGWNSGLGIDYFVRGLTLYAWSLQDGKCYSSLEHYSQCWAETTVLVAQEPFPSKPFSATLLTTSTFCRNSIRCSTSTVAYVSGMQDFPFVHNAHPITFHELLRSEFSSDSITGIATVSFANLFV